MFERSDDSNRNDSHQPCDGRCVLRDVVPNMTRLSKPSSLHSTGQPNRSAMSDFATARQKMVDGQVRTADVTDIRILDAMLALPREVFVPAAKRALAYLDLDLDVTEGGSVPRCLITPMLLAKLLQAAEIRPGDNVLIVG